jgi:hypothetical protein
VRLRFSPQTTSRGGVFIRAETQPAEYTDSLGRPITNGLFRRVRRNGSFGGSSDSSYGLSYSFYDSWEHSVLHFALFVAGVGLVAAAAAITF